MNKKISVLIMVTAISAAFCLSACGGDKNKETTKATTAAATTAATKASSEAASSETEKQDTGSENSDGIPKEGDTYKGKKVGAVEKVPDCDDDKHGVIYIYDENEDLIEAKKY